MWHTFNVWNLISNVINVILLFEPSNQLMTIHCTPLLTKNSSLPVIRKYAL